MKMLQELQKLLEQTSKDSKDCVSKVYHRDYLKTKNKPYRKYKPEKEKTQS